MRKNGIANSAYRSNEKIGITNSDYRNSEKIGITNSDYQIKTFEKLAQTIKNPRL